MGGQEQLHNTKSWFCSHRGEHIRVLGDFVYGFPGLRGWHISIIAERRLGVKPFYEGLFWILIRPTEGYANSTEHLTVRELNPAPPPLQFLAGARQLNAPITRARHGVSVQLQLKMRLDVSFYSLVSTMRRFKVLYLLIPEAR
jgi:hypothetical protein